MRLEGTLTVRDHSGRTTTAARAKSKDFYLEDVELTARRAKTNIGIIHDPGHAQAWIIAMSDKPGYRTTLAYSERWGIEPMFSDFKSRGFGIDNTQLRYPDRLARLILVTALALYSAVSTGQGTQFTIRPPPKKTSDAPARQGGPLQGLLVQTRPAPDRKAHAGSDAPAAPLGDLKLIDGQGRRSSIGGLHFRYCVAEPHRIVDDTVIMHNGEPLNC